MKCPRCARNQRRGKEGMTCKSCSYKFLFDPKKDRLSGTTALHDFRFQKIINHASAKGTYHFTPNQFYSSARSFSKSGLVGCLILVVVVSVFLVISLVNNILPFIIITAIIGIVGLLTLIKTLIRGPGPSRKKWNRFVSRWQKAGHPIPGLIASPALSDPPPQWTEPDIYDYGVSGIILCDRVEIVDWLVLNQFHTQTNTLILTADGYPQYLSELAQKLVEQTPALPVHLLHDPKTTAAQLLAKSFLQTSNANDLGIEGSTLERLRELRKRFGSSRLRDLPLDAVPYKTISAALTHCIVNGVVLGSILGADISDSDTDISFG